MILTINPFIITKDKSFSQLDELHVDLLRVPWHRSSHLKALGSLGVLLLYGLHSSSEVLVEDLEQEGHVTAVYVEGAEGQFEGFQVVELLREVLLVVFFCGHGEAADREIGHLCQKENTTDLRLCLLVSQPRGHSSRLMQSAMWKSQEGQQGMQRFSSADFLSCVSISSAMHFSLISQIISSLVFSLAISSIFQANSNSDRFCSLPSLLSMYSPTIYQQSQKAFCAISQHSQCLHEDISYSFFEDFSAAICSIHLTTTALQCFSLLNISTPLCRVSQCSPNFPKFLSSAAVATIKASSSTSSNPNPILIISQLTMLRRSICLMNFAFLPFLSWQSFKISSDSSSTSQSASPQVCECCSSSFNQFSIVSNILSTIIHTCLCSEEAEWQIMMLKQSNFLGGCGWKCFCVFVFVAEAVVKHDEGDDERAHAGAVEVKLVFHQLLYVTQCYNLSQQHSIKGSLYKVRLVACSEEFVGIIVFLLALPEVLIFHLRHDLQI